MSFATLLVQPVDVITPGARTDAYGDTTIDWTTATESATNGWLAQLSSIEDLDGRDGTSSTLTLSLPADTVIDAQCRVRIAGRVYEVDNEPLRAWTPRGVHHIECQLKVVDG